MKNAASKLILAVTMLFTNNFGYAGINDPADFNPYFKIGTCKTDSCCFVTENDGQMFINKNDDFELRLKQNTKISLTDDKLALTDELSLEEGLVGLKVASDTLLIKTPYADVRLRNATVVIKVSKHMTRLCVLKGSAVFKQKTNIVSVKAGNEIAASKNKISQTYKFLDDLRYVWYWTTPDKEPSLK